MRTYVTSTLLFVLGFSTLMSPTVVHAEANQCAKIFATETDSRATTQALDAQKRPGYGLPSEVG